MRSTPPAARRLRVHREREFHDALAADLEPALLPRVALGEVDAAMLELLGSLEGTELLELGCGSGDLTLELVARGASVTALDVSPGMVAVARERVGRHLAAAECIFCVAEAEDTGLSEAGFDLIVGRYIIHHLDTARAAREIARLLRPGGRAVFLETSARNPLLMLARDHLAGRAGIPRYGTKDERPLDLREVEILGAGVSEVRLDFPVFEFFRVFDRQVLRFRFAALSRLLSAFDRFIQRRLPRLRPFSYRVIVTLVK